MNLTIELSDRQKKAFLLHNHEVGISESEAHKFMEYKKIFIDFECLFDIDVAIAFELCFKYNKLNIFKWGNDNIPDVGYMRSILRNKGTNPIKCMVKNPEDPDGLISKRMRIFMLMYLRMLHHILPVSIDSLIRYSKIQMLLSL